MSRLTVVDQRLCLRFSRAEKVMGILRDLEAPLDRVVSADPLQESSPGGGTGDASWSTSDAGSRPYVSSFGKARPPTKYW